MLLDTSFLIDIMEKDEGALLRKQKLEDDLETYRISSATIFELWSGIASSKKSEEEKAKVTNAISELEIINVTRPLAEKGGEIHGLLRREGNAIDPIDAMIAATALLENETVLTRNVKHFSRVRGLRVESY